jgi:sugar lactone lactonase YvrE
MNNNLLTIIFLCFYNIFTLQAQQPVLNNPKVEKLAGGFTFVEGPVWVPNLGVLFSDIPENKVYLFAPDSTVSVYVTPSGNSNGLLLDLNQKLILAQHGYRQVARQISGSQYQPIATHYNGKKLNSPNDLAQLPNGTLFFTDPPYGISPEQNEQGFSGIYSVTKSGKVHLLDKSMNRPNGIVFSTDFKKVYVSDSEARELYQWDVVNDSTIANKTLLASLGNTGNADGLKVDKNGFIYCTGPGGVWVFDATGGHLFTIPIAGQTTNCAFGGQQADTLYVTSGGALYRVTNQ